MFAHRFGFLCLFFLFIHFDFDCLCACTDIYAGVII